jgi:hypothetical protein
MHTRVLLQWIALIAAMLLSAAVARGQEVGTIAALEGTVEIGRTGTWSAAVLGAAVQQGDTVRTGTPGRARIVFQDDSVITIADASEVTIDESTFDPNAGIARKLLRLGIGRIRAIVSEYYKEPRAKFEIETTTAVIGVRGTEFIVAFDPATLVTDVVGVSGRARVHSVRDRAGHAVFVSTRELTTVARGQYPTKPQPISDERYQQYLQGLEFTGSGAAESLAATLPPQTGESVAEAERASTEPAPPQVQAATPPAADGLHGPPNAAALIGQPPAIVDQGLVGIHF